MKKTLIFLIIILSLILMAGCVSNSSYEAPEDEGEEVPDEPLMAPDFELEEMDGSLIKLSKLRGKNVILNFWYAGCTFCVIEMPDLQKLQETYKDDFLLLTINVGDSKEVIEEFMEENKLNLTVLLDQKMNVAYDYGIRSFPTTIAVNKKGEVIGGYVGMLTYEQMKELYRFFE